ncbi:hypothetical protein QAD02_018516 [Eretmocerus hayati]|uniref:Uncharacterized protein n=1 Tax=Eretmocerus hayati TaxID=131215 RepID=A0ACC2PHD5_9HYME|nr:hypothetical protein QAD02_018516 [Eretmocerus hayati]
MESRPAPLRSRRVCRFCLVDSDPLNYIYDRELTRPFSVPLSIQIMSCVGIEVYSADGMPQMICTNCRWNLDRSYRFKQQCRKADEALRSYPVTGVLPRPFPPLNNDPPEQSNKRSMESRPMNDQAKKARMDNGDRDRQSIPEEKIMMASQQIETHSEKQQRENDNEDSIEDQAQEAPPSSKNETMVQSETDGDQADSGKIRVHACDQCERTFPLAQALRLHVIRAHRNRDFKCSECERMFFSKYDLNKHMSTHTDEKPFACQVCQKQFSRANLLQRHEKVHRDELRYGCNQCDREFFSQEDLEKHEEATHKANKPFECSICNKRFTYKQGLERHEMLHSDDKNYVCEYCKEAFRTSTKLARHLQTHAGHRPYLCKLCPRSFLLSHHLTRHMRTHSVEKRHVCEDCGKAFKRAESLEVHQLTHVKRSGMGLTCDVCHESCRNRADYVTHIKHHIEAGEKMGPDSLQNTSMKDTSKDTESEEEDDEEEEEEQYSDGDEEYRPPAYLYPKKSQSPRSGPKQRTESEEDQMEAEQSGRQVIYVKGKDGNMMKKTIKTLMPVQRRAEPQQQYQQQEMRPKQMSVSNSKEAQPQKSRDETEAQVQKIVASVFKEHKIPLKSQAPQEAVQETIVQRQTSQSVAPTIIKEEKVENQMASVGAKNPNTVKVIKRIVVRKPAGSADSGAMTSPVKEFAQEAAASNQQAAGPASGPKVTKRVIVRRIIRQGDTTREVIMNPDGTIIDPAELAKLPTGNVVKRVVVKKPLDKSQNIESMLQAGDTKRILKLAESGEDVVKASTLIPMPRPQATRVAQVAPVTQVTQAAPEDTQNDREKQDKIERLQKEVEQQRLKIEALEARKHEFEACGDEMIPERHDESEDEHEQQLPLKRVFVKRKQCNYVEEREYEDDRDREDGNHQEGLTDVPKEEQLTQSSTNLENAKIIIIKPESGQQDVDEMSRELCSILESTDTVVKMQENVLNNLEQITSVEHTNVQHVVNEETLQNEERLETSESEFIEQPMEQEEVVAENVEENQVHEQVIENSGEQQDPAVKIVITQSEEEGVKLEFEDRTESGLSNLSTQVIMSESHNDIFETTGSTMEVDKTQEGTNLEESVIELSETNNTINLNETTDSRDSLEDKLSQMEG